jgi:CubicO group peptidase (beta-lactamase class C family)
MAVAPQLAKAQETHASAVKSGWQEYRKAEDAGFSSRRLRQIEPRLEDLKPDLGAMMVVYKGKVLLKWGDLEYKYKCHSIRKSFLSALIGIYVDNGTIDLTDTIAALGIDDDPPLWESEKRAKVLHLITSRSGVYHQAAAEAPEMVAARPERGSHAPGTFWYYNNWDFNALGTIFRQETGKDIFQEFRDKIADKIGMQDYLPADGEYSYEHDKSIHPAYPFRMSTRDRARFGQLFLQEGRWNGDQLVPESWVNKSTKPYSRDATAPGIGYGYMWWTIDKNAGVIDLFDPEGELEEVRKYSIFFASGYRGHSIEIIPEADMVIVWSVDTDLGVFNVDLDEVEKIRILELIMEAKEFETIDLEIIKSVTKSKAEDTIRVKTRIRNNSREASQPVVMSYYLSKDARFSKKDKLIGSVQMDAIKAGKKRTVRLTIQFDGSTAPGSYYVISCVDKDDVSVDPYRDNNVFISAKKIIVN